MLTLVFDTCFNSTYIVLKKDNDIVKSELIKNTQENYHSAFLIPKLSEILRENNIMVKDIDAIGVNVGPGSFTGIRACLTTARVLAQQFNIKICPVNSLMILSRLNSLKTKTITILDARKNKVYYCEFLNGKQLTEIELTEKEDMLKRISADDTIITDNSIYKYLEENGIKSINYEEHGENLGIYLSEITEEMLKREDNDFHWAKAKPVYIQPPSITKPKELQNVQN